MQSAYKLKEIKETIRHDKKRATKLGQLKEIGNEPEIEDPFNID